MHSSIDDNVKSISTVCHLHKWFKRVFEKLGWIVLASGEDKESHRVEEYVHCLEKLYTELTLKINEVECKDTKTDLRLMQKKLMILIKFVHSFINTELRAPLGALIAKEIANMGEQWDAKMAINKHGKEMTHDDAFKNMKGGNKKLPSKKSSKKSSKKQIKRSSKK